MKRNHLLSASLAIILSASSPAAHAWPLGRLFHLHPAPAAARDQRIPFEVYNSSGIIQVIDIGSRTYQLLPNSGLTVAAPEGTQVIGRTVGLGRHQGELLVAVDAPLRNRTLILH